MKTFLTVTTLALVLGNIHLTRASTANGIALPAGRYEVRVTDDFPVPAVGQSADSERWVEFIQGNKVVGREIASVIQPDAIAAIAKGARPARNGSLIQTLKGADYVRVWINRDAIHYVINLPTAR